MKKSISSVLVQDKYYEFWLHFPEIGPEEVRIRIPGDSEKEARQNWIKFIRAIRERRIRHQ